VLAVSPYSQLLVALAEALRGLKVTSNQVHQRCFARAIGANHSDSGLHVDPEVQILHHEIVAVWILEFGVLHLN